MNFAESSSGLRRSAQFSLRAALLAMAGACSVVFAVSQFPTQAVVLGLCIAPAGAVVLAMIVRSAFDYHVPDTYFPDSPRDQNKAARVESIDPGGKSTS